MVRSCTFTVASMIGSKKGRKESEDKMLFVLVRDKLMVLSMQSNAFAAAAGLFCFGVKSISSLQEGLAIVRIAMRNIVVLVMVRIRRCRKLKEWLEKAST